MKNILQTLIAISLSATATAQTVELVKDISQQIGGNNSSSIYDLNVANGKLYFFANVAGSVNKFMSDGTATGTVVFDNGGRDYTFYNGKTYYRNNGLWSTDGIIGNEVQINNLDIRQILGVYFNKLFLVVYDASSGRELWVSDGTAAGTTLLKDILPGADNGVDIDMSVTEMNDKLFFRGHSAIGDIEPWITDGTITGTKLLKDIAPIYGSAPRLFTKHDGKIYFTVAANTSEELWVTDGTTVNTIKVTDFSDAVYHVITSMVSYNGKLMLSRTRIASPNNFSLWSSDGTTAGTAQVTLNNVDEIGTLWVLNDKLLISGTDTNGDWGVIAYDGNTAGTAFIAKTDPGLGARVASFVRNFAGKTYFFTTYDGPNQNSIYSYLWYTDGTAAGTGLLMPFSNIYGVLNDHSGPVFKPGGLAVMDNSMYFSAMIDPAVGYEFYKIDAVNTVVPVMQQEQNLSVYPTPTTGDLHVSIVNDGIAHVVVHNMQGQLVYSRQNVSAVPVLHLYLQEQAAGVYFLTVKTNSGKILARKVIKQ